MDFNSTFATPPYIHSVSDHDLRQQTTPSPVNVHDAALDSLNSRSTLSQMPLLTESARQKLLDQFGREWSFLPSPVSHLTSTNVERTFDLPPFSNHIMNLVLCKKVDFWTPVSYSTDDQGCAAKKAHGFTAKCVEFFDDFFTPVSTIFLGGRKAEISEAAKHEKTEGYGELKKINEPWYATALKVISCLTLIIPAIMLIGKLIARSRIEYCVPQGFVEEVQKQFDGRSQSSTPTNES